MLRKKRAEVFPLTNQNRKEVQAIADNVEAWRWAGIQ